MRDAAIDPFRQTGRGARPQSSGAPPLDGMLGEGPVSRGPKPAGRKAGAITSAAIAAKRLGGGRGTAAQSLGRARPSPGLVARLRGRLPRVKPFKALTVTAFSLALVGIVANAMVFQRGHHPAPLFGLGQSLDGQGDAPPRTAVAVPVAPPPAAIPPAERTGTIAAAPAAEAPVPAAAPKPAPIHHAAAKPHHEDGVGGAKAKAAEAHPRPGHAVAKLDAKPAAKPEAKPDAVAQLLAEPAHPAKPAVKAPVAIKAAVEKAPVGKAADNKTADGKATPPSAPPAKPDHDHGAKVAPASPPHHRLAAAPVDGAKAAPRTPAKKAPETE